VASLPHSTGCFALDIPLEITGTLAKPSARPAPGSAAELPDRMPRCRPIYGRSATAMACAR